MKSKVALVLGIVFAAVSMSQVSQAEDLELPPHLICDALVLSSACGTGQIRVELRDGKFQASLGDVMCWGAPFDLQGAFVDQGRGGHPFFARHLELEGIGTLDVRVKALNGSTLALPRLNTPAPEEGRTGILLRTQYDLRCKRVTPTLPRPHRDCRNAWIHGCEG